MTIPSSTLSIVDGGMGITGGDVTGFSAKIGVCSGGVAGTAYTYRGTDTNQVVTDLGSGPLVDATIKHLLQSNGKPVIALKATAGTAGSSSAVTQSGAGPAVTLSGAPYDQGEGIVEIMFPGARGTATFRYTLDGGDSYSDTFATAATYALPNGVTLNFAVGTYVLGETYSWTDTAPAMTLTNVGDALDDLIELATDVEFVHVVGFAVDASASATLTATIQTKIEAAHAAHKYMWAIQEGPPVDKANMIAAYPAVSAKYTSVAAGFAELVNNRSGQIQKRSIARTLVPRIARNPLDVLPIRNEADATIDPLTDVVELVPAGAAASTGYHDEGRTPGLDAARFSSLMSIVGVQGFYPCNALTMASAGSDFGQVASVRIICAAARAYYQWSLNQLGKRIRKLRATGYILPSVADALEADATAAVQAAVGRFVDGVSVKFNRADDLAADPTLRAKVRVIGPSWALEIDTEIGFAESLPEAA